MATACSGGTIRLWEAATGAELRKVENIFLCLNSVAFSPDGTRVAAGGDLGLVQGSGLPGTEAVRAVLLWDLVSGKQLYALPLHEDDEEAAAAVNAVALSPDGRLLTSAGADGVVRVWEVATGRLRLSLAGHRGPVASVAFSRDGQALASAGADMTALLWDLAPAGFDREQAGRVLGNKELQALWADLASDDPVTAHRAVWGLASSPREAVPFLREHLKGVQEALRKVPQLVTDLCSNRFDVREKASAELEQIVEQAEPALRQALAADPPLEAQRRLERLSAKIEFPVRSPERLRRLRALEALERATRQTVR
jgi:hypothetical protein